MIDSAMGMTPEEEWTGKYDANGGIIIAKDDGEVLCYHIYDFNVFQDYLVNNTKFEQASTGEDEDNPGHERKQKVGEKGKPKNYYFGWLYQKDNEYYFKLNLQVRFT